MNDSLVSLIARLPKAELHLHLEGSVQPETLRELARSKGRLSRETEDWIGERTRRRFRYRNFSEFLNAFKLVSLLLESPADYALAITRLMEALARENVRYAEITLATGVILWKKQPLDAIFEAIAQATDEATVRFGLRVNWIFDAIRQFGADHARDVLRWAARFRELGVVAFGIGGDEQRGPAEAFTEVYREARDLGLHTTAHAGETVGPESVRKAVELLGAERIGHGLTASQDPEVLALLRERAIPLEACLTSNVSTGVLGRLEDHPLPRFLEAGVVVTVNSDDPAMFGTSLGRELELAAKSFSLSPEQILGICKNAIYGSFLPQHEQESLAEQLPATTGNSAKRGHKRLEPRPRAQSV